MSTQAFTASITQSARADPADGQPGSAAATGKPRHVRRGGIRGMRVIAAAIISVATVVLLAQVALFAFMIGARVAGSPLVAVMGGSMEPTIHLGDGVILRRLDPYEASHLHAGEIVTLRAPGATSAADGQRYVTHRIARVIPAGKAPSWSGISSAQVSYRTKGDANHSDDAEYWPSSAVVGVVAHRVPKAGFAISFYGSWPGRVVSLLPVLALLMIALLREAVLGERTGGSPSRGDVGISEDGTDDSESVVR